MLPEPHLFLDETARPPRRTWVPLVLSAVLHLLVLGTAVELTRARTDVVRTGDDTVATPSEQRVVMVTLPPYPKAEPKPLPRRAAEPPPPVPPRQMPRPQVERGQKLPEDVTVAPERPPDTGPLTEAPAERAPDASRSAPPRTVEDPAAAPAPTMESEAERLFGRKQTGVAYASGPEPFARWVQVMTDDRANDCRPKQLPVRPPGTPPELGYVSGQVFREGTRIPLSGAFLQILGTPYSTFADDDGHYRLAFDRSLVDECRTQYVQVSKDGFRPRRLILGIGPEQSNDIPMSRY